MVDKPATDVPPPPGGECRDRREWAMGLGAADAELDAFVGGRTTVVRIGDSEQPFRTSPSTRSKAVEWSDGQWQPLKG